MKPELTTTSRTIKPLSPGQGVCIVLLFAIPAAAAVLKLSGTEIGDWFNTWLSFESLPVEMRHRSEHLLLAPLAALIVVFVRLTLGIRVLGPFRSLLLAIAFMTTGLVLGLAFLTLVILVVVLLRPRLRKLKLAYFGRSSAMLASVAATIILASLIGIATGMRDIERVVYFPIVVLTLAGDAFASTVRREGLKSAVWRVSATAALAVAIAACGKIHWLQTLLVQFPELALVALGLILINARFFKLRLLKKLNPTPRKRVRRKPAARTLADPPSIEPATLPAPIADPLGVEYAYRSCSKS